MSDTEIRFGDKNEKKNDRNQIRKKNNGRFLPNNPIELFFSDSTHENVDLKLSLNDKNIRLHQVARITPPSPCILHTYLNI